MNNNDGTSSMAFDIEAEIRRQQVDLLYRNAFLPIAANALNGSLLAYVNYTLGASAKLAASWAFLLIAIALGRFFLVHKYVRAKPDSAVCNSWLQRYYVGTIIAASVWGVGTFLFMWHAPEAIYLFTGLVVSGTAAGGIASLGPVLKAYRAFALLMLVPMSATIFLQAATPLEWTFGGMTVAFLVLVLRGAGSVHETVAASIRLRLEQQVLLRSVEDARDEAEATLAELEKRDAALEESEERYRLILQNSPAGIFHYDDDLVITYCNERFAEILHAPRGKVIGLDMKSLRDQRILPSLRKALEGSTETYEGEYQATLSSRRLWISMSSSPLIGANNATEGGVAIVEDITTRRVDEEALRQSETRLRLMLETSPIAVRIAGNAGHKVLFANQRYAQLIVSTPEATLGVDPSAYYADANAYQEILDVLAKGEHVTNRLIELRMRDGQTKWAWASYLMLDFENEPAVLGWFYDVTEQKKVEMALRESEAKLRDIAEYTYDWDYWLGPDGHLIYVSPSCERITGYRPEEFMAAPDLLHRIVHPEYQELLVSHLHGTEQKDACELEFVIINKKGEARWIAHGCRPIFDTEGRYLGRRSSNRDITANKEAEVEYRTIIQTMQDGFLLVGADTHFVDVNDAYCQMLGYTRDEVLGLAIADIEAVKDDTGVIRPTDEILLHGHAHFETRHRRKDGSAIDVELTASRLESRGGVLIALVRDISERKAAEAEIHQWAYFDRLTNLPNRRLLEDRLQQQVVRAKREHQRLSLLFVDLDKFKPINDKLGHDVGDWLLQAVAQRMQGCVRESDTVARMGGDEFVVLLPNVKVIEDAIGVAHKVRLALQEPFITLNDRKLEITSSIGVALYPDHADNLRDLLRCGDEAMYRAKRAGRNAVEVFPVDESTSGWESLPSAGDRPVVHLIWKSDYTCGEPTIDDEHREMFRLANALLDQALARNLDSDAVRKAFDALLNHVVKHFADEEAILAANGYPLLNEHAELHRQLVVHAKKLRQRTEEAGSSLGEIVEFLVSEVVSRHMLREDRKFAGLFSRGIGIVRSNASNGLTG